MARKKPEHKPVHRTDLLPSNLAAGKERAVREVLAAYRAGAVMLGREQWRLFFETGRFDRNFDADKTTYAAVVGAANRVQMCRSQVVGQLQGWIGNRANEFRDAVVRSSLPPETQHMLHVVNRADLDAARNIGARRARAIGSAFRKRTAVLAVRGLGERRVHATRSGGRGPTADPRASNPCFKGFARGSDVAGPRPSQHPVTIRGKAIVPNVYLRSA